MSMFNDGNILYGSVNYVRDVNRVARRCALQLTLYTTVFKSHSNSKVPCFNLFLRGLVKLQRNISVEPAPYPICTRYGVTPLL